MPERITRSVPVPSSSVNFSSFFDFFTASHALTFTARKSDLLNVSKSTKSANSGSICTLEKSIFSSTAGAAGAASVGFGSAVSDFLSESSGFMVGIRFLTWNSCVEALLILCFAYRSHFPVCDNSVHFPAESIHHSGAPSGVCGATPTFRTSERL